MFQENPGIHPVKKAAIMTGKMAIGGLLGFGVAKIIPPLFWLGVRKLNPHAQLPVRKYTPRHKTIGQGLMVAGGLSGNPYLMGVGGGLIASDSDNSVLRKQEWIKNKDQKPTELNMYRYNVPDWMPWAAKYEILADILKELVTKPTYNAQKEIWIPPGREHPDVLNKAREIAHNNNLDGHNKIEVLKAIQKWVQNNINYVYDPRWLDTFAHPYITLKKKAEDCDGQALLSASLGEALGLPMALILIGQKDDKQYNHILSAGIVDKRLIPIETIPIAGKKAAFGFMPPYIHKKVIPLP